LPPPVNFLVVTVIVGTQWGDEGKGKITDIYSAESDLIVRFQGGNNAGHTIVAKGEVFKLHLIPSGIVHGERMAIMGNGMVVDMEVLNSEINDLEGRGFTTKNLRISDRASIILPYHKVLDGLGEQLRKGKPIGTTKRGIGPAYGDKIARSGIRFHDLLDPEALREKLVHNCEMKNRMVSAMGGEDKFDADEMFTYATEQAKPLLQRITDTSKLINESIDQGKSVLMEGAQGTFLDIDHGTYPFVTSSNTLAGAACSAAGIGPGRLNKVMGIVKAYTTRVGEGPFPTELFDETGERLRDKGGEFGTTTDRPRRCGWLDMVLLRTAARLNGITHISVTKVDVLNGFDEIKVATAYNVNGETITDFPADLKKLDGCQLEFRTFPGWGEHTEEELSAFVEAGYDSLPHNMKDYLEYIASEMGAVLEIVSLGPQREMTIRRS